MCLQGPYPGVELLLGDITAQTMQAMLPGICNRLRGCQRNRSFIFSLSLWSFFGFSLVLAW
jgi:hypothetical protein